MPESKPVSVFRTTKLRLDEKIQASCEGYIGDVMGHGKRTQRFGALIVKTFEPWDSLLRILEQRGSSAGAAPAPASPAPASHLDRLPKLGGLRDAGLITEAELTAKRGNPGADLGPRPERA